MLIKEKLSKRQEEEILRLLCEVRAKNGLPPGRINRAMKRLNLGKLDLPVESEA